MHGQSLGSAATSAGLAFLLIGSAVQGDVPPTTIVAATEAFLSTPGLPTGLHIQSENTHRWNGCWLLDKTGTPPNFSRSWWY